MHGVSLLEMAQFLSESRVSTQYLISMKIFINKTIDITKQRKLGWKYIVRRVLLIVELLINWLIKFTKLSL